MMRKVPREGLADLLEKLAVHTRKYVLTGMSVHFDGSMYRVAVEGEGELLEDGSEHENQPNRNEAAQ
ncbi:MAG TPA: hypothetical protein VMY18_11125 [Acidobacteriota bacterium]|nr:hypothetical protein [Acidobacteriota bacterium]